MNPTAYTETRPNGEYRAEWAGAGIYSLQFRASRARIFRHFAFVKGSEEQVPVDGIKARIVIHAERGY